MQGQQDFQKESDGQLTIFSENFHEQESKQFLQEDKIMTFNFNQEITKSVKYYQSELSNLKAQQQFFANSDLSPDRILELIIKSVSKMEELEVEGDLICEWGDAIYKAITGITEKEAFQRRYKKELEIFESQKKIELNYRDSLNKLQVINNKLVESVAELTQKWIDEKSNNTFGQNLDAITQERDKLLQEYNDLLQITDKITAERDTALQQYTDSQSAALRISEQLKARNDEISQLKLGNREPDDLVIEGYKKTIASLTITNQELCEKLNKLQAESPQATSDDQVEGEDPRQNPEYLEAAKNQEIAAKFMKNIDRKARVDSLTWEKFKDLPINADILKEIGLAARTKTHQYLLEKLPLVCAAYINETGDSSDLEWLPSSFVDKVMALIDNAENETTDEVEEEEKKSTSPFEDSGIKPGDTVIMRNEQSPYLNQEGYVLDSHNGWLNVKDPDGTTDMWKISDVELVANLAA